jgi:ectoine hydroxylase-related dioxygenase (phytanoyl-CoA dioxygenase family)
MSLTAAAPTSAGLRAELDGHFAITRDHIAFYREFGYIKLKDVLSPQVLEYYGRRITEKVFEFNTLNIPMEQRNTYQKAFLQIPNLWNRDEVVKEFAFSRKLARMAAELMEVRGVRMYHDQALHKEPSGGITPWHADQFYWPLSSDRTITAWIPLQETPLELGPLAFAEKSQGFTFGRDLEISDESEKQIQAALEKANFHINEGPFSLGELSFHSGWTFHRAGPNKSTRARGVMTMIYMDKDIRIIEPRYEAHRNDLADWLPGCKPGDVAASELNPVLWEK